MSERQHVEAGTKTGLQRQTAYQAPEPKSGDRFSPVRDLLTRVTARPGDSAARAQAALLNRSTSGQPARAARSLLQLQRM